MRNYIRGILLSAPWLAAVALFWFYRYSEMPSVETTLLYGVYKVCIAVMLTWLTDVSLNLGSPPAMHAREQGNFLPQIRRAIYFLGIAWILSVS